MLKLIGSILILTSSILYGWKLTVELGEHVNQLIAMKEMFLMLSGEISYTKTPLPEAFLQIAAQNKEPFSAFLKKASQGILESEEEQIGEFWKKLVEQEAERFLFTKEERGLLQKAGENFGYLDGQMQLKNLELYIGQAQVMIQQSQSELKERQKVYQCLSVMCGLFLIILLI
ncbi:MAG: stage III sporulation protein AB [Lachnospiraceae bacterium]